jgi:hypothetical protein
MLSGIGNSGRNCWRLACEWPLQSGGSDEHKRAFERQAVRNAWMLNNILYVDPLLHSAAVQTQKEKVDTSKPMRESSGVQTTGDPSSSRSTARWLLVLFGRLIVRIRTMSKKSDSESPYFHWVDADRIYAHSLSIELYPLEMERLMRCVCAFPNLDKFDICVYCGRIRER